MELLFDGPDGTFPPNIPGEFSVGIHQGGITGPVIGTSSAITLLSGIFREVVRFDFPTSVPLVPGNLYAIEINRLSDPSPRSSSAQLRRTRIRWQRDYQWTVEA
jgi:hypothetical protein